MIKLNSYLGLDKRGNKKLSCLKTICKTKFTDQYCRRTGIGILGTKLGKAVDLSVRAPQDRLEEEQEENDLKNMNLSFFAVPRSTLFYNSQTDAGQQRFETTAKSGFRNVKKEALNE